MKKSIGFVVLVGLSLGAPALMASPPVLFAGPTVVVSGQRTGPAAPPAMASHAFVAVAPLTRDDLAAAKLQVRTAFPNAHSFRGPSRPRPTPIANLTQPVVLDFANLSATQTGGVWGSLGVTSSPLVSPALVFGSPPGAPYAGLRGCPTSGCLPPPSGMVIDWPSVVSTVLLHYSVAEGATFLLDCALQAVTTNMQNAAYWTNGTSIGSGTANVSSGHLLLGFLTTSSTVGVSWQLTDQSSWGNLQSCTLTQVSD